MRLIMKALGLLAMVFALTTAAVAAPENSTRIPGAPAAGDFRVAASGQVCCMVGEDDDWSQSAQACYAQRGKVVANSVCNEPDDADDDDDGPDDGVDDDDGGPDDADDGPDDGKED